MSPFMETATITTVNTPTHPHPSQLSKAELTPPSSSLCKNSACISSPDCGAWTVLDALEYWRDSFSVSMEKLLDSTTVPFRPATLQMPNFALVQTNRITGHLSTCRKVGHWFDSPKGSLVGFFAALQL